MVKIPEGAKWMQLTRADYPQLKPMLQATIATESYYTLLADADDEDCIDYWFGGREPEVWALEKDGKVLGAFYLRANHRGLGTHIANAGFMVAPETRGQGIGRILGGKCLERAKERGFRGMQFNFVVAENEHAVKLWKSLGFSIIGTIPGAYHFKRERYVDAHIMFKDLTDGG